MLTAPRSARLVAAGTAWLSGSLSLPDLVRRVSGDDEPHQVEDVPGADAALPLADALLTLVEGGTAAWTLALPVPGDPLGVAGPRTVVEAAVAAQEAALVHGAGGGPTYALVPLVCAFGPPGDEGHLVTWRCLPAAAPADPPGLAEADRALRTAVLAAAEELATLDVAAWRPELGALLAGVRSAAAVEPLPGCYPPPAQALAARASRLLAVVGLALGADGSESGGARSAAAASARRTALLPLDRAARYGLVAAYGAVAEQALAAPAVVRRSAGVPRGAPGRR